jgi:hypothetical protein
MFLTVYPARPASGQVLLRIDGRDRDRPERRHGSGAEVTVTNTSTGLSRQTTTNEAGYYSIPSLPEGSYDLSVGVSGFKPYVQKGIRVSINVVTRVDATIQVGVLSEEVRVEATTALLQTTKSDVSVSFDTPAMENLPLSGYRNYQSLFNLVPGAVPARFQNAVTDTPGRSLTTNVNGQERGANNTRVDGSADVLVTMPHHAVDVPPVESIQGSQHREPTASMPSRAWRRRCGHRDHQGGHQLFPRDRLCHERQQGAAHADMGRERAGVNEKPESNRKLWRYPRRPDQEEQAVLLCELRGHVRTRGQLRALFRSHR